MDLIFDKYEVIRRLAIGGMGEIFLSRQTGIPGFERLVILKSLLPDLAREEERVSRFLDEARVAATLNHPNIVQIFEVGLWRGTYFIAMEYVNGVSLAELQIEASQRKQEGVPFPVAASIIRDSAKALDHAHKATDVGGKPLNIVHRDISPQNIMVTIEGVAKVVDFGIATAANRWTRTATGNIHGKLAYMSPEQARAEPLDGRSDQFALGVVLWEMCSGERLLKGSDTVRTLSKVLDDPIPRLMDVRPSSPPALDAVLARMLERDRNERYATCTEAADALDGYLDSISREYGKPGVAAYIESISGTEIKDRVSDLTPSGSDFLISLGGGQERRTELSGSRTIDIAGTSETSVIDPGASGSQATLAAARGEGATRVHGADGITNTDTLVAAAYGATAARNRATVVGMVLAVMIGVLAAFGYGKWYAKAPASLGSVSIRTPVGARILLDDVPRPEVVPAILSDVSAGPHIFRFEADGKEPIVRPVIVVENQTIEVKESFPVDRAQNPVLNIDSDPSGASVWLSGQALGTTPLELTNLAANVEHVLRIIAEHHNPEELRIALAPGQAVRRTVKLQKTAKTPKHARATPRRPKTPPPPPRRNEPLEDGTVTMRTTPWTHVTVDGRPYGTTPVFKKRLSPGKHKVRFVNKQASIDHHQEIVVVSGENLKVDLRL